MYYFLILFAVLLFGLNFAAYDGYRKICGSGIVVSLRSTLIGGVAGLLVLFIYSGFVFEYTPFSLLMALLAAVAGIGFTFFSFKALEKVNLSLYSVFSMLGGMVLPFLQGVLFYNEAITLSKMLCFLLVAASLFLTVACGCGRKGAIYYAGVFILNGASGVLSKIFISAPYEKVSAVGYSILLAILLILVSLFALLVLRLFGVRADKRETFTSFGLCSLSGALNKVANFILVVALLHVDASVQYPMVTGGVMIVSTLLCFFGKRKPTLRELLSVLFAFLGTLCLFVVPI